MPNEEDSKNESREYDEEYSSNSNPESVAEIDKEPDTSEIALTDHLKTELSSETDHAEPMPVVPLQSKPKKSHKKAIFAGAFGLVLLLLVGGGVLAYNVWYQNPQKVLGDALANLYSAKATHGTFSYTSTDAGSNANVNVTLNAASADSQFSADVDAKVTYQGKNVDLKGAGAYDKSGNAYFKLSGIKSAMQSLGSTVIPSGYTSIIEKYDDKWVKISASDIKNANPNTEKSQKCLDDINARLKDKSFQNDIASAYRNNQFVVVNEKLGAKDGNLGYKISTDQTKAKSFINDFKQTKSYGAIKANCGEMFDSSDSSTMSGADNNSSVDVWISRWSHKLKTVTASDNVDSGKTNFTTRLDYNASQNVTIPSDTIPLSELQKDLDSLVDSSYSGIQSRAQTSENQSLALVIQKKAEAYNAANGHYPTYKEFLAAKDEAELEPEQAAKFSQVTPSAANNDVIQYVLENKSSGYIAYYDFQSAKVIKMSFGSTSTST